MRHRYTLLILVLWGLIIIGLPALATERHSESTQPAELTEHPADVTGDGDVQTGHAIDSAPTGDHGTTADQSKHGHQELGPLLPLWSCIPFACMLLSIALVSSGSTQILAPSFWKNFRLLGGVAGSTVSFCV